MKTTILLSFIFVTLTVLSCQKKEYTCVCGGGITGKGVIIDIESSSKPSAKKKCYSHNSPTGTPDGLSGCELK